MNTIYITMYVTAWFAALKLIINSREYQIKVIPLTGITLNYKPGQGPKL